MRCGPPRAKVRSEVIGCLVWSMIQSAAALTFSYARSRRSIEFDVVADDPAEGFVRLRRFEATVKVDRGLDIAVPKQAPHVLVLAGMMLEVDCRRGMPELMNRY